MYMNTILLDAFTNCMENVFDIFANIIITIFIDGDRIVHEYAGL